MVRICSVFTCSKTNEDGITLFTLPKKEELNNKWKAFLEEANLDYKTKPKQTEYVCSDHFEIALLKRQDRNNSLMWMPGALPVLVGGKAIIIHHEQTEMDTGNREVGTKSLCHMEVQVDNISDQLLYQEKVIRSLKSVLARQAGALRRSKETIYAYRLQLNKYIRRDARVVLAQKRKLSTPKNCPPKKVPYAACENHGKALLDELSRRLSMRRNYEYSDSLREFAFQINYFSPRAYGKLRQSISTFPHPRTFRKWTENIDTRPGFLKQAMDFIRKRVAESPHQIYYALSLDEVHIRKQIIAHNGGFVGFVDYADLMDENELSEKTVATAALFIMANEVNGQHKIPIAYVLTNGLKQAVLMQVIRNCLDKMNQMNACVLTITFDGLPANLNAVERLGAKMDITSQDFKPYIEDTTGRHVHVILDPSHMLKLKRNLFKEYGVLVNENGEEIKWDYIMKLQKVQEQEGLRAANKLSVQHTHYDNQKMKTRLAAQTLSGSTANALRFAREIGIDGFEGSKPTEEFLHTMNKLFDFLNSIPRGKGFRKPLRWKDIDYISTFFKFCKSYLLGLKRRKFEIVGNERVVTDVPLVKTARKTAVVGLIIAMTSIENIMRETLSDPSSSLKYLPVFKLSQDPLENFFGVLRSRFGCNNNPNAIQLMYALRGILCMKTGSINTGNCIEQEDTSTRICALGSLKNVTDLSEQSLQSSIEEEHDEEIDFHELSLFSRNIVMYISGFVAKRLLDKLHCPSCIYKLYASEADIDLIGPDAKLVMLKDNGGLFLTSYSTFSVCKLAEEVVRRKKDSLQELTLEYVIRNVIRECEQQDLISLLRCEKSIEYSEEDHSKDLVTEIVRKYWCVRSLHLARSATFSVKPVSNRQKLTKLYLFSGN